MERMSTSDLARLPLRVGDRASGVITAMRRAAAALLSCVCLAALAATAGCESPALGATSTGATVGNATDSAAPASRQTVAPPSSQAALRQGPALAALATLAVKGRAPKTGYTRDQFGRGWIDVDRNGCDTRNDILRRDLAPFVLKAGTHGCLVLSGTLQDPYTGATIPFVRGQQTSTAVQIDHVVALSDAWQKGAQHWDAATRERFANDPLNLLAVDGPSNSRKGDGDAATWQPPAKGYRCRYVARQVAVKAAYGVWVTAAERAAITRVLASCPAEPLPAAGSTTLGGGPERAAAPAASRTTSSQAGSSEVAGAQSGVVYENCTAVRAAGADPIRVGDPGYSRRLDRDGDGVACE
jgi:hypothetical protein